MYHGYEPWFDDKADYSTNAKSYYDYLAKNKHLLKLLSKKIWEYDKTLNKKLSEIEATLNDYIIKNDNLLKERLKNWDDRIDNLDTEVEHIFIEWLEDGTLEKIINHDVLGNKADRHWIDMSYYVTNEENDEYNYEEAIKDLPDKGGILYFPPGRYKVIPENLGGILIENKKDFVMIGWGATLYNDPLVITNSLPSTRFLRIKNCSNFKILGFTFDYNVSWESSVSSGLNRDEQLLEIWADTGEKCDNFEILNNTFKYTGPSLNYYPDNITNRFSVILLASQTSDGKNEKNVSNFKISNNHFSNCVGRICYTLLAKLGIISNNTFENMGLVYDPKYKEQNFVETVGIRNLVSSDIDVTNNVMKAVEYVPDKQVDKGNIKALYVGNGGINGLFSESINFENNIVSFSNAGGWFFTLGDSKKIKIKNNNVKFLDTNYPTYGIRSEESGIKENIEFSGNTIVNPMTHIYLESGSDENYKYIIFKNNTFVSELNTLVSISEKSKKRLNMYSNFWSDKNSMTNGVERTRELSSYRLPPLNGDFTQGDICLNTGFDMLESPVIKWVYQYKGAVNYWRPINFPIYVRSAPPELFETDNEKLQFMGLQYIEADTNKVLTFNGNKWVYSDGTLKE